jgi:hypothetical protein
MGLSGRLEVTISPNNSKRAQEDSELRTTMKELVSEITSTFPTEVQKPQT